jgi:glycopeptide antibiotics resistance protein
MPGTHHEIPALPVVVPLAAAAAVLMLWRLHRRAAVTVPRLLVVALICVYGAGVLAAVLFPIRLGRAGGGVSWTAFLNLVPLVNTEPFDMVENVVMFVPLGLLLPLIARVDSARRILLYGFVVSLSIEAVQFLADLALNGGHAVDVNDLLANTLGALFGYGSLRGALRVPAVRRLAGATRSGSLNWAG